MRDQFTFYRSFWEAVAGLKKADRLAVLEAIIKYALNEETVVLQGAPAGMFALIKPVLDSASKRAKNGQIGGSKQKANSKQTESKTDANWKQTLSKKEGEKEIEVDIEVESESYTPTLDEVRSFCSASGLRTDPEYFWNYYESRGWNGVKDWKARIRAWDAKDHKPAEDQFTPGEAELKAIEALKKRRTNSDTGNTYRSRTWWRDTLRPSDFFLTL